MPGLLSDDGYIYQRRIVIYYVLSHILQNDLAECFIELRCVATSDEEKIYSIDFFIKTNMGFQKYYEVKKQQSLHYKSSLKPIIDNFNDKYIEDPAQNTEFHLVHACQVRGEYFPKFDLSVAQKNSAMREINPSYAEGFCEKFFSKQILDSIDNNLMCSDIELRSIAIIDKISKEYNIMEYGAAEGIYHSIRSCFENLESQEAERLKRRVTEQLGITYPIGDAMRVDLHALLDHNNSFFDKIATLPRFTDRISAVNDFYSKFSIPAVAVPRTQI